MMFRELRRTISNDMSNGWRYGVRTRTPREVGTVNPADGYVVEAVEPVAVRHYRRAGRPSPTVVDGQLLFPFNLGWCGTPGEVVPAEYNVECLECLAMMRENGLTTRNPAA